MPRYRSEWPGPPAPVVDVRVTWAGQSRSVPGILDTGADCTVIPSDMARALHLRQVSEMETRNADGRVSRTPIYVGDIEFGGFAFPTTPLLGTDLPVALVGRDLLNSLIAHFDGPALTFSLSQP